MTDSDVLAAAEVAAAASGRPKKGPTPGGGPMGPRARGRARIPATESDDKSLGLLALIWADWRDAWWWTAEPASRTEVVAQRVPSPDRVPDGSPPLRWGWAVWMHAVAVPVTWALLPAAGMRPTLLRQVLRGLVWVFQHPARFALAAPIVAVLSFMWIKF